MRNLFSKLFFVLLCCSLYGYSGYMAGEKDIRCVSTKYFDIIFPVSSEKTASLLCENADKIHETICADLDISPSFKMPVIITTATDIFNAYFTTAFENHIVLFDTIPESDMIIFSDTILGTFTHELTHALTTNMKNKQFQLFARVLGDGINLGSTLFLPRFVSEGAAVAEESKISENEGRLNDAYYFHTVKQAKLSGKFPWWWDVEGSRDIYPGLGMSYDFGGPFTEFIQKKYGMQKYSLLWYNAVNFQTWSLWADFKNVYGISLSQAWQDFYDSIELPEISPDPLDNKGVYSFFDNKIMNEKGSRYIYLTQNKNSFAYLDDPSQSVYLVNVDGEGNYSKPKKLFAMKNICSLRISEDGTMLAVGYYDINHAAPKNQIGIYLIESKKWIKYKETSLRYPCVIKNNEDYYVAAVKNKKQNNFIKLYKLQPKSKKLTEKILFYSEIPLEEDEIALDINSAGSGKLVFLSHQKTKWCIKSFGNIFDDEKVVSKKEISFANPQIRIHDLNVYTADENHFKCSFSVADSKASFPSLGIFDSLNCEFSIMDDDISGGVYYPVVFENKDKINAVYSGYFVDNYKLLKMEDIKHNLNFKTELCVIESEQSNSEGNLTEINYNDFLSSSFKYNKPFLKGLLLPYAGNLSYKNLYSDSINGLNAASATVLGLSYMTDNPWNSESLSFGGGYEIWSKSGGAFVSYDLKNETSVFELSEKLNVLFDSLGLLQISNDFSVSSGWRMGNYCSFAFGLNNSAFYGRSFYETDYELDTLMQFKYNYDLTNYIYNKNQIFVGFSSLHSVGSGQYENFGFSVNGMYNLEYLTAAGSRSSVNLIDGSGALGWNGPIYHNISFKTSLTLPKILPLYEKAGFTYNFPLVCDFLIYPSSMVFCGAEFQTVLFGWEIQKATGYLPFYLSRLLCTADYNIYWHKQNGNFAICNIISDFSQMYSMKYTDYVSLSLFLNSNINFGSLSLEGGYTFAVNANYILHNEGSKINKFSFSLDNTLKF